MNLTDRQRDRLRHLERELQQHQREAARIQWVPPTARTSEQFDMLNHHLHLQGVIRRMIAAEFPTAHQAPIK